MDRQLPPPQNLNQPGPLRPNSAIFTAFGAGPSDDPLYQVQDLYGEVALPDEWTQGVEERELDSELNPEAAPFDPNAPKPEKWTDEKSWNWAARTFPQLGLPLIEEDGPRKGLPIDGQEFPQGGPSQGFPQGGPSQAFLQLSMGGNQMQYSPPMPQAPPFPPRGLLPQGPPPPPPLSSFTGSNHQRASSTGAAAGPYQSRAGSSQSAAGHLRRASGPPQGSAGSSQGAAGSFQGAAGPSRNASGPPQGSAGSLQGSPPNLPNLDPAHLNALTEYERNPDYMTDVQDGGNSAQYLRDLYESFDNVMEALLRVYGVTQNIRTLNFEFVMNILMNYKDNNGQTQVLNKNAPELQQFQGGSGLVTMIDTSKEEKDIFFTPAVVDPQHGWYLLPRGNFLTTPESSKRLANRPKFFIMKMHHQLTRFFYMPNGCFVRVGGQMNKIDAGFLKIGSGPFSLLEKNMIQELITRFHVAHGWKNLPEACNRMTEITGKNPGMQRGSLGEYFKPHDNMRQNQLLNTTPLPPGVFIPIKYDPSPDVKYDIYTCFLFGESEYAGNLHAVVEHNTFLNQLIIPIAGMTGFYIQNAAVKPRNEGNTWYQLPPSGYLVVNPVNFQKWAVKYAKPYSKHGVFYYFKDIQYPQIHGHMYERISAMMQQAEPSRPLTGAHLNRNAATNQRQNLPQARPLTVFNPPGPQRTIHRRPEVYAKMIQNLQRQQQGYGNSGMPPQPVYRRPST